MERRLLVNYRVDPDLLASFLPAPFLPALVGGYGIAGICSIRLSQVRPAGVPAKLGLTSENAAHRVAVCWDDAAGPVTGVYVPRRDTSSRLSALARAAVPDSAFLMGGLATTWHPQPPLRFTARVPKP